MIKIFESLGDMPITVRVKNGEKIEYVSPNALKYKYILAKYSDEDRVWYYHGADDDFGKLQQIASRIPWTTVDPWIVKVDDCEVI